MPFFFSVAHQHFYAQTWFIKWTFWLQISPSTICRVYLWKQTGCKNRIRTVNDTCSYLLSARTLRGEHRCWRQGDNVAFLRAELKRSFSQRIIFIHTVHCFFFLLNECFLISNRQVWLCQRVWSRLHRVTAVPPSLAALAFGSDQDYQLDIISELDLANATYGITQVAGLHNNSKAFLFRGNARTHSRTPTVPFRRSSGPSLSHTRAHATVCFISKCDQRRARHTFAAWRARHPGERPLIITPHFLGPLAADAPTLQDSLERHVTLINRGSHRKCCLSNSCFSEVWMFVGDGDQKCAFPWKDADEGWMWQVVSQVELGFTFLQQPRF